MTTVLTHFASARPARAGLRPVLLLLAAVVVVIGIVACEQPGPTTAAPDAQQFALSDGAALEAVSAQRESSTTCELGNCSDASSGDVDSGAGSRCPETIPVHETECSPFVRCVYAKVHCYCSAHSTWQCHPFLPAGTDHPPHDTPIEGDAGNPKDVNPTHVAPPTAAPPSTTPYWQCDAGPITDASTSLDAQADWEPEHNPPDASVSPLDASYDSGTEAGSDSSSFTSDQDTLRSAVPRH